MVVVCRLNAVRQVVHLIGAPSFTGCAFILSESALLASKEEDMRQDPKTHCDDLDLPLTSPCLICSHSPRNSLWESSTDMQKPSKLVAGDIILLSLEEHEAPDECMFVKKGQ